MKIKKKGLLLSIFMLMMAVCMLFAACNGSNKVKISFDTDGGPAIESVELEVGAEYTLPVPERTGYSFEGWYDNAERTGSAVTSIKAEKDVTFYAKWNQLCLINLQLGGGSLSAGTSFYVAEGTNIYTYVQSFVPTLADHEFGEWLVDGKSLTATQTITKEGITLTAHYKVAYTVEIYLQNLDKSYKKAENDIVGYEYAGVEVSPAPEMEGFKLSTEEHNDAVTKKTLSENASENVFRFYLDREMVRLMLDANYPGEAPENAPSSEMLTLLFGTEIELPATLFTYAGYCLIGWSTTKDGEVEYRSGYIDTLLHNGTYGSDPYTVDATSILYAVWVQGYSDLFGGGDYIFHLSETAEEVYLLRGGVMFVGTYNTRTGVFLFTTPTDSGNTLVAQGKLNEDGTFSYYSDVRDGFSYTYFKNGVGANADYTIYLDAYNGIKYVDKTLSSLDNESIGTYTVDENNLYYVTYTTGPKAGESYYYVLSSSQSGAIFMVRDEEEFGWGAIPRLGIYDSNIVTYRPEYYSLTLNGFGNAYYANGDGTYSSYYYVREDNVIRVLNGYGMPVFEAHLMTISGSLGYFLYSASYDVTYESESGETLKLDGMFRATYVDEKGVSTEGVYSLYSSLFGTLIRFYGEDSEHLFLARTVSETVLGEDGTSVKVNHYYFDEKPLSYSGEYNYTEDGKILSSLIIVLNDEEEGKASVYGMNGQEYVKVLSGSYIYDEENDIYSFTTETVFDVTLSSEPFAVASVKAFVFSTDLVLSSSGDYYNVFYWHSMTTEEGTTNYDVKYTAADGATFTLFRGFGVYRTAEGEIATGAYFTSDDGITSLIDYANQKIYYFELNEEERSFVVLDDLLGTLNALLEDGYVARYETLTFDGKGGVVYSLPTVGEDGQSVIKTYEGTYTRTGEETSFGYYIYKFESEEVSFKFIFAAVSSSATYFAKYNEAVCGEYTSDTGELILDGFSFLATYYDYMSGESYDGIYSIVEENVIQMMTSIGFIYFDLKDDTFTVRDEAFGTYLIVNNQSIAGQFLDFDGYGNLTVFTVDENRDRVVLGEGKYRKEEDGSYVLTYKAGVDDVTLIGWLGVISTSSTAYNAFFISYDEVVTSYVIERDLSVLVLDNRGNARRYDKVGKAEQGAYVIVTENMLYYAGESEACIYIYDKANGTAKPINYAERAYYSKDFDALLFTRYGFMVMGGETRYYYNVASNGNVLLYRQDASDPTANKYGFVEETFFGRFDDEKVIDGITYYASSSFTLTFTRKADSKGLYPVPVTGPDDKHPLEQLKFSPSGASQFSDSNATVRINGKEYTCTVVRLSDGEMYITIASFRFDIKVTYRGDYSDDVNEYEITAMRAQTIMYSYTYLNYLLNYLMQGYYLPNSFGMITLFTVYDEEGNAGEPCATGVFGPDSGLYDTNGDLVSFENIGYTYENRIYTVEFEAKDGYTYRMHFALETGFYNYLGMYAYGLHAFTRVEEIEAEGGYTICIERVIMTENPYVSIGGYWTITMNKGEEELTLDANAIVGGKFYYLVRTRDEETKRITSTTLYVIEFKQRTPVDIEDVVGELEPYVSATVTERKLNVAYTEDGKSLVEYDEKEVLILTIGSRSYLVASSEYNAETGIYTVTLASGTMYTVSVKDGVAIITLVETDKE